MWIISMPTWALIILIYLWIGTLFVAAERAATAKIRNKATLIESIIVLTLFWPAFTHRIFNYTREK